MTDRLSLSTVLAGLRRALPEARTLVRGPAEASATALRLLVDDLDGTREFVGRADLLASYLRHEAGAAAFDSGTCSLVADSEATWIDAWGRSETLRAEFRGDREAFLAYCRSEKRQGRVVGDAHVPGISLRSGEARSLVQPTGGVVLAEEPNRAVGHSRSTPAMVREPSARLSLTEAGATLGLRIDALQKVAGFVAALRGVGLEVSGGGGRLELGRAGVERLAADGVAVGELMVRLARAMPSLGHVGNSHEVSFSK